MTIKRRLFISNILMLVIPIVACILIISSMAYTAMHIFGVWQKGEDNGDFYDVVDEVIEYTQDYGYDIDIAKVTDYLDKHAARLEDMKVSIVIYQAGQQIYSAGEVADGSFIEAAMAERGEHFFSIDEMNMFKTELGEYALLITGSEGGIVSSIHNPATYRRLANLVFFVVVILVAVVFVTNRLLTRMVIKSIINPLDTLVYGVHQIRDGNLDYRIDYKGRDEFAPVCEDFNEMAQRLMDMVNARQKDDENRRELIAGISHDLRTPLTSIKAYVEGLEEGVASTPQLQKQYMATIKSKTEDLEHIVTQLFLFSKIDIGDFSLSSESLDIGAELEKFIAGVADEYEGRGLAIELAGNTRGLIAEADSVQLRNVYTNLLENTVKYGNREDLRMLVECSREGSSACVSWQDNGPGVADEALGKIFDVFYRGDRARSNTSQGSGLGLAISAKIMALMGGSIHAENVQEGGLRITLKLPVAEGVHTDEKHTDN